MQCKTEHENQKDCIRMQSIKQQYRKNKLGLNYAKLRRAWANYQIASYCHGSKLQGVSEWLKKSLSFLLSLQSKNSIIIQKLSIFVAFGGEKLRKYAKYIEIKE